MDPNSVTPAIVPIIRAGAPIVISIVILLTFGATVTLVLTRGLPAGSEPIVMMLIGALVGMVSQVSNFWIGSSSGSRDKDATIAAAKTMAPAPPTMPIP